MLRHSRGQSLIESLVALTILVIGIMGAVSLGIYTVRGAEASQENIVIMNLAQEGIEGVRWLRDRNWKMGDTWYEGLSGADVTQGRIEVNSPESAEPYTFVEPPAAADLTQFCTLCFDNSTGLYSHAPAGQDCEDIGLTDTGIQRLVVNWSLRDGNTRFTSFVFMYASGSEPIVDDPTHSLTEELYDWWP